MKLLRHTLPATIFALAAIVAGVAAATAVRDRPPAAAPEAPPTLRATGLYSDWQAKTIAPANRPYAPQYPLWSDGARKGRWIHLPAPLTETSAGWEFPVGTKVWKEFSFGRRAETRYMERTDAGWIFASYAWSADETEATRVAEAGQPTDVEIAPGRLHVIPGQRDCAACHGNAVSPVLGFSALQLSEDRDPNAPHAEPRPDGALDLGGLVAAGLAPPLPVAPRIAARDPDERAALGYLHANCGPCHRAEGPLATIGMDLAANALATTLDRPSHVSIDGARIRIVPGEPDASVLVRRMNSRAPVAAMPPMGTELVDAAAVSLLTRWISHLSPSTPHEVTENRR